MKTAQAFQVCVFDDFAATAAKRFVNCCVGLLSQRGRIHVALTGGKTAEEFYRALARPEIRQPLAVEAIQFYEGDERPVGPTNPDSNWGMAESTFLDPAAVPPTNRFRMYGEAENLDEAAGQYESLLRQKLPHDGGAPAFDLLLLGMGENGHIASLFPGTAALQESERLVVANEIPQLNLTRLTITYPMINAARAVWILVSGSAKARTVHQALEARDSTLPVVHVAPRSGPLAWLLDRDAGAQLSSHVIINE